jgi:hypothetical protein
VGRDHRAEILSGRTPELISHQLQLPCVVHIWRQRTGAGAHGGRRRPGRRLQRLNNFQPPLGHHALTEVPRLLCDTPLLVLPYWRSSQSDLAHAARTFARLVAPATAASREAITLAVAGDLLSVGALA